MTIKELLIMVDNQFANYHETDDDYLEQLLSEASLYERDWHDRSGHSKESDILITYDTDEPFDMQQLNKDLKPGYHVYWGTIHFGDILISYFKNKIEAFNYYRTLTPEILTCERALIDTSKGIIASEKLTGDTMKMAQYDLFRSWLQKKYPIGTRVQVLQLYKHSDLDILTSRSPLIGQIGTVVEHGNTNIITVDFGDAGAQQIEVGKDQIRIIKGV